MLAAIIITLISAAALLIVCWMLAEYWLRSVRKFSVEKISSLSIWSRMVFALEDFCGGVNHKKDFRIMRVEEEMESIPRSERTDAHKKNQGHIKKEHSVQETFHSERRYKIKENM